MAQLTFKPLILTLALLILACPASAVESLCSVMVKVDKAPQVSLFREVGDDERLQLLTRILYEVPGVDLKGSAAQKNRSTELTEIIEWVSGVKGGTLAKLYNYIRVSRKIPWLDWLNQSGLDGYRIVGKTDGAITDGDIVRSIQALERAGKSISQKDFATDRTEESRTIIEAEIGKALTPSQILTRAESFDGDKGTWDWWLKEAGFEPELIRQRRSEIPEAKLSAILLALEATKVDLNASAVQSNQSEEVAKQIFEATGYSLKPSQIHTWVTVNLGKPWIPTLHEAGVDLSKIKFRNTGITKENIVQFIHAMNKLKIGLWAWNLANDGSVESALGIYRETGFFIRPSSIYDLAGERFDLGWDEALVAAGFNPEEIRRQGWVNLALLNAAQLQERRRLVGREQALRRQTARTRNAVTDAVETIVVDNSTPEDEWARNSVHDYIDALDEKLNAREQVLFELLLEAVTQLQLESESWDLDDVVEVVFSKAPEVTHEDLMALIEKVSSDNQLMEIFGTGGEG